MNAAPINHTRTFRTEEDAEWGHARYAQLHAATGPLENVFSPKPYGHQGAVLVMEHLDLGESLGQTLRRLIEAGEIEPATRLCHSLGCVLARLHEHRAYIQMTGSEQPQMRRFVHGDFGFSNIFVVDSPSPAFLIIDPLPPAYAQLDAFCCTDPLSDVGMLIGQLSGRAPIARVSRRVRLALIEAFLQGYSIVGVEDRSVLQWTDRQLARYQATLRRRIVKHWLVAAHRWRAARLTRVALESARNEPDAP